MPYHKPVLLKQSIDGLKINPDGIYVDLTFGGGGHARAILDSLENGKLIAFDQDEDAVKNRIDDSRFVFINHNFRFLKHFLVYYNIEKVDGILGDLGVSSHQFDSPDRGFSFRWEQSHLDMRMNRNVDFTARDIINSYNEKQLEEVLHQYGEIDNARRIAERVVKRREAKTIESMDDLTGILSDQAPRNRENKFMAKIFQALRIEVNKEMESLKHVLNQSVNVLAKGGRLVIISYHSLEDRMVKNFIKSGNFAGNIQKDFFGNAKTPLKQVNRKPIVPGQEEIENNNRARSAKLRIAEKL